MPTAPITASDLTTRFPEMADVDSNLVGTILAEVHERVGGHWPDGLRAQAQLYLAAHMIAAEGGASRTIAGAAVGAVVRRKEGDVEVQFGDAGGEGARGLASTTYGKEYQRLSSVAFGGAVFAV